jgi:hypothetical protein
LEKVRFRIEKTMHHSTSSRDISAFNYSKSRLKPLLNKLKPPLGCGFPPSFHYGGQGCKIVFEFKI